MQIEGGTYRSVGAPCAVGGRLRSSVGHDPTVDLDVSGPETVTVDTGVLAVAVEEALSNARKYREPGTPISLEATFVPGADAGRRSAAADWPAWREALFVGGVVRDGDGWLFVSMVNRVRADATRLTDDECARAFEAGYKAPGEGSVASDGMGLDSVAMAVAAGGGLARLRTYEDLGGGGARTAFEVVLPATAAPPSRPSTATGLPPRPGGGVDLGMGVPRAATAPPRAAGRSSEVDEALAAANDFAARYGRKAAPAYASPAEGTADLPPGGILDATHAAGLRCVGLDDDEVTGGLLQRGSLSQPPPPSHITCHPIQVIQVIHGVIFREFLGVDEEHYRSMGSEVKPCPSHHIVRHHHATSTTILSHLHQHDVTSTSPISTHRSSRSTRLSTSPSAAATCTASRESKKNGTSGRSTSP